MLGELYTLIFIFTHEWYNTYVIIMHEPPSVLLKFAFLEIFQNPPGGLFVAARRHILFWVVYGFLTRTAWWHVADR